MTPPALCWTLSLASCWRRIPCNGRQVTGQVTRRKCRGDGDPRPPSALPAALESHCERVVVGGNGGVNGALSHTWFSLLETQHPWHYLKDDGAARSASD